MNTLDEVSRCLKNGKRAVICGHEMPDGDSIGSVLAMGFLLSEMGLETYVLTPDKIPAVYDFLPCSGEIRTVENLPEKCDLAVVLDCTDMNRLGDKISRYISDISLVVNIDHHISNREFGHYNYVDSTAAAAGEIVFELIKHMGVTINSNMAVNLYTAIVMDTGSFRFNNTSSRTHEVAAELVKTGLDIAEINRNLFERKEYVHLKLLSYALDHLQTSGKGRIAWISLPLSIMLELGAGDEHAEGIINYPRMLEGAEIGILFREIVPGKVKVGLRSNKYSDVNKLAAEFGGGGHPRAAGCLVDGSMEDVESRVIDLCARALDTGNSI
ncbi:DHH family phosphoesterase [Phosphitispora sp. TUW77]|uniref:DHH family phosphoesterase n=1 Tax=Phosphitispora sp. TUW77 TaxID=3152361 RepID=UPI003AB6BFF4